MIVARRLLLWVTTQLAMENSTEHRILVIALLRRHFYLLANQYIISPHLQFKWFIYLVTYFTQYFILADIFSCIIFSMKVRFRYTLWYYTDNYLYWILLGIYFTIIFKALYILCTTLQTSMTHCQKGKYSISSCLNIIKMIYK